MKDNSIINKRIPKIDAIPKVKGHFQYTSDKKLPGMLHGKVLRSPYPHAVIESIDTTQAEAMDGVYAVVTGRDVPEHKYGPNGDENILAIDKVRYIGDEVAAVAAETEKIAKEALKKIVVKYKKLPGVFSMEEAFSHEAPLVHEDKKSNVTLELKLDIGDVRKGFEQSDYIFENTFSTQWMHQLYLEPNIALVEWDHDDNVTFYTTSQHASIARLQNAEALGIPPTKVRIIQSRGGGAFGGKFDPKVGLIAAMLSKKAKRPVRIETTLEEDFIAGRPQVPAKIKIKTGVMRDGTLVAKETFLLLDNGAYLGMAGGVLSVAGTRSDSLYRIENIKTEGYLVYTNNVPTGALRGFGNQQIHFAVECQMDIIAKQLGIDPIDLRLKNATRTGDTTIHGWEIASCGLSDSLTKAREVSSWDISREQKYGNRPGIKYGLGVASCIHVSGNRASYGPFDCSSVEIRLIEDGKVVVLPAEPDFGQGAHTIVAQMVANELGVGMDQIIVRDLDTQESPLGLGAHGSRVTTVCGHAAIIAARKAKEAIIAKASQMLNIPSAELVIVQGIVISLNGEKKLSLAQIVEEMLLENRGLSLVFQGMFEPNTVMPDPVTKYGNISTAYSFATHVAEVAVDTLTGKVDLVNYWALHDSGTPINLDGAEGQIEGGVVQGAGFALSEEMIINQGKVVNPDYLDYKSLTAADLPNIEAILLDVNDPLGPYGAKGLAEPCIVPVAPAIANAVYDAIGTRFYELPITPQKVLAEIQKKGNEANDQKAI